MTEMSMGSNIELSTTAVRAALSWTSGPSAPDVDASALLLDASGKVAAESDFVFYNQPRHPGGAVVMAGRTPGPDAADPIDVDLARLPDTVTRVVVAASADGGTFGAVPDMRLVLSDARTGAVIATFPMRADAETAFVCAEFYRRNQAWRFRAIGQGYSSGLAGLASDFGIDAVEPAAAAPPAPPEPPVPAQPAASAPARAAAPAAAPVAAAPAAAAPAARPATPGGPGDSLLDLDRPFGSLGL